MKPMKNGRIAQLVASALAASSLWPAGTSAEPTSENSEHMAAIVREIVNCGELDGTDWIEVSAIFGIDDDGDVNQSYGYAYDRSGKAHAVAFLYDPVERAVRQYREWLRVKDDKGIIKLLIQFNKETRKFNAAFEYDDPKRWQVTPNNVDAIIRKLRPDLGG